MLDDACGARPVVAAGVVDPPRPAQQGRWRVGPLAQPVGCGAEQKALVFALELNA